MKVYIVLSGCYSDQYVYGASLDKDIAEAMAKLVEYPKIEAHDLSEDKSLIARTASLVPKWEVKFSINGDVREVNKTSEWDERKPACMHPWQDNITLVYTDDDNAERVVKIARATRAEYLAKKYGI